LGAFAGFNLTTGNNNNAAQTKGTKQRRVTTMVDLSIEANGGDAVKAKRRRRTHFIPPRGHVGLPPMSVRLRDCLEKEGNPQFADLPRQNHYPPPELRVRRRLTPKQQPRT